MFILENTCRVSARETDEQMRIDGGIGDHATGTFVPKVAGPPFVVLWFLE